VLIVAQVAVIKATQTIMWTITLAPIFSFVIGI